jgi:hypothetical protein
VATRFPPGCSIQGVRHQRRTSQSLGHASRLCPDHFCQDHIKPDATRKKSSNLSPSVLTVAKEVHQDHYWILLVQGFSILSKVMQQAQLSSDGSCLAMGRRRGGKQSGEQGHQGWAVCSIDSPHVSAGRLLEARYTSSVRGIAYDITRSIATDPHRYVSTSQPVAKAHSAKRLAQMRR